MIFIFITVLFSAENRVVGENERNTKIYETIKSILGGERSKSEEKRIEGNV